jgi:hypothetical protein
MSAGTVCPLPGPHRTPRGCWVSPGESIFAESYYTKALRIGWLRVSVDLCQRSAALGRAWGLGSTRREVGPPPVACDGAKPLGMKPPKGGGPRRKDAAAPEIANGQVARTCRGQRQEE